MEPTLIRSADITDIPIIAELAKRIWPICYSAMLTPDAIAYMLDLFYSQNALYNQMTELDHRFLIADHDGVAVGFASYAVNFPQLGNAKLHKLYVLTSQHHHGLGSKLVNEVEQQALQAQQHTLLLHVNRGNPALHFYEKLGFQIVQSEDIDIGSGYWMNDYLMSKPL